MPRPWVCPVALSLVVSLGTARAADHPVGQAPFGLAWGPMERVATPSMVDREANLTGLYYFHDRPPASGPDTVRVILVVCREQGLQQVVWIGRSLDAAAHAAARETLRREGVRLHGDPRPGPFPDSLEWPAERTLLATRAMPDGTRELVLSSSGPDYAACSDSHRTATGHPADAHVADLLGAIVP